MLLKAHFDFDILLFTRMNSHGLIVWVRVFFPYRHRDSMRDRAVPVWEREVHYAEMGV